MSIMGCKSDICKNILNIPTEVLTQIIIRLNPRDRLALSRTCKKLNNLILEDEIFVRNLDFSSDAGYMTAVSDLKAYFTDKINHKYILKINVGDIYWTSQVGVLKCISRAQNLIDLNIKGFKFQGSNEFGGFLEPLKNLERLSCDWPIGQNRLSNKKVKIVLGRLIYFSVTICEPKDKWSLIDSFEDCIELEELYLLQTYPRRETTRNRFWLQAMKTLPKLKKVVCCGCDTGVFHTIVIEMISDPNNWSKILKNEFGQIHYFYLEKNLEVVPELLDGLYYQFDPRNPNDQIVSKNVRHGYLFNQIIDRFIENTRAKKMCQMHFGSAAFRIEDAKLLMKNLSHQMVPYLNLSHSIELECDMHLVGSAFPMLKKLVVQNIVRYKRSYLGMLFQTGGKRKREDSDESDEYNETLSPHGTFKKLVDNLPNLQDLTVCASCYVGCHWDVTALNLIADWKNLKSLYLVNVPLMNGEFLIEIGRQCTQLEKLRLENLGSSLNCCYRESLLKMLPYCQNLKDFSIQQNNFSGISDLFETLSKNLKLKRVYVQSLGRKRGVARILKPISNLISRCDLVLFACEIKGMTRAIGDQLKTNLARLKDTLHRPLFQFEVLVWIGITKPSRNVDLELVHKDLMLSHNYNDVLLRMGY